MTRQIGLVVFILHLAMGAIGQELREMRGSNNDATDSRMQVLEKSASATFKQDGIRVKLPLSAAAGSGVQVTAWLVAPNDARSGERPVTIRPGERSAAFTLDWPRDAKGKRVDDVSWYRILYRIDANGVETAHGILSVGAIAANLMELRMARPGTLAAGKPILIRVYAGNPITRKPFKGVQLKAMLELESNSSGEDKTSKRTIVREAVTDESGEALIPFPKKEAVIESVSLTVHGSLKSPNGGYAEAAIGSDLTQYDSANIHIDTDKPLHKPGEVVHLRALILAYGRVMANRAVTLTISDPERETLLEAPLTTNRFGIAAYDWKTGSQLATGDYAAEFALSKTAEDRGSGRKTISIQRYDLPEFSVTVAMDRGYYLEGQTPVAHIHAGYLFGKPVAAGTVRVAHTDDQKWNPKTHQYESTDEPEQTATLDANGNAEVRLDVKKDYDEFKSREDQRYSDVDFHAVVADASSGRSEPLKFTIRLSRDPIHIYLRHLDGNESEGNFVFTTSHANGGPVACKVTLDWLDDNGRPTRAAGAVTSRHGLAKVHLNFPPFMDVKSYHDQKIRLTARNAEGTISRFDDTVFWENSPIWITVVHTLLKPNQSIEAVIYAPKGITLDLDVHSREGLLQHRQIHMAHAMEPVEIPAGAAFHGLITLMACQMNADLPEYRYAEACNHKSVLYPEDRMLKLRLTGLQRSYAPGAEVNAGLDLQGAVGVLGVSVFDTAVEQRAKTEEDENDRWSRSKWWQNDENVSGVTVEDLNRIDTSKPIPADLDLLAETLIGGSAVQQIDILSNREDSDSARDTYKSGMNEALKPLGAAILAARLERLPATFEAIQNIARAAKLDDALLLDPWNTPYRVSTSIEGDDEVVSLRSAGPDKRFGTDDDFTIQLIKRNYFELPGERLTALVRETVKAGEPLPANEKELKALALARGLDLEKTLDPQGKPYHYQAQVQRRDYTIHVFSHDAVMQPDGLYSSREAWSSPAINYFSQIEGRLSAALRAWEEAGKPFP